MNAIAVRVNAVASWVALPIAGVALAALYAPIVAGMVDEWSRFPNLSHGFAIGPIALFLVWGRRAEIQAAPLGSSLVGLPILIIALAMVVVGSLGGEPFLPRLSMPLAILGTLLFLGGRALVRQTWAGIVYLFFMVPVPYVALKAITYQSRLFDAAVTATIVQGLGIPILRDGVMLQIPNMTLEVADECSSIPAIAALVALGAAYAQMQPRPTWVRTVLILASAPLGLASNIVRIVLTAVSAYYFGRIALDNVIHKFNGTSVFMLTVFLLMAVDTVLMRLHRRRQR